MTDALPPLLQEVERIAGLEAAIAIARTLGGRRMYVPANPRPGHPLTKAVGRQAASVIGGHFGGEHINWPKAQTYLNRLDACALKMEGLSAERIARKLNLTERYVRRVTRGVERGKLAPETAPRQPEACPSCGRRFHRRPTPACDVRQLALPHVLD